MSLSSAAGSGPAGVSGARGGLKVVLTGYEGHEDEVLHVRNANRETAQSRQYLDWRYRPLPGLPAPRIAWMRSDSGEAVGMAAAIFRPFCIDGVPSNVAVVGDISLDQRLRGQGLGQALLAGLTRELGQGTSGSPALVIPNEAARRSLDGLGWRRAGQLNPHVCPVDPALSLTRRGRNATLAAALGTPIRGALALSAKLRARKGFAIRLTDEFDESFDDLWARLPKGGLILSGRASATLTWRYHEHPTRRFTVARFVCGVKLRGYVVFETAQPESEWSIQDIVVADRSDLPCMLALLIDHCFDTGGVSTIRLALSDGHPYARWLWRLGFVPRATQGTFQVLEPSRPGGRFEGRWCLTQGDKDI